MKASARILLALLAFSLPVLAQAISGGTIRGRILPAQGETDLPGLVMVRIIGAGFQEVTYVSGAFFAFTGVRDGNYTIYVSANGREEVAQDVSDFTADRNNVVTIVLGNRTPDKNEPPPGNTVVDLKTLRVPEKAQAEVQKGLDDLNKTRFQKAAQHFEVAIKICPGFYQAHNNLGVAYIKLNRLEDAGSQFARAVELDPDNVTGLKNLAYLRMNRGRFQDAIDPLAKAVSLDGTDAKAEMYLGEAYTMKNAAAEAKDHFLKALVLDPTLAHAHYRLGYIFLAEKQYEEALKHFQGFLKLNPNKGADEVQAVVAKLEQYFKDSLARASINPAP